MSKTEVWKGKETHRYPLVLGPREIKRLAEIQETTGEELVLILRRAITREHLAFKIESRGNFVGEVTPDNQVVKTYRLI